MGLKPVVSVIVPVYNSEKYLHRCINSILKQSFTDFELILVDDGSPDRCGDICDEYAQKDNRVKVIHKENGGVSDARNAAFDCAIGDYICFVDSDDYIHEDLLKDNLEKMIVAGADLIVFNYAEVLKNKIVERLKVKSVEYDRLWYFSKAPVIVVCKLYKSFIWKNLRFPTGLKHEDNYVMPHVITAAKKIITNEKVYYFYDKTNESSIMSTLNLSDWRYMLFLSAMEKVKCARGQYAYLRNYALKEALIKALQAYNFNIVFKFLNKKQMQEIESFLVKNKAKGSILGIEYKLYFWGYFHCKLINKIKGLYYYFKYKNRTCQS